MARGKDELTPKQARFVEEYLVDLNATQAAVRAGYSVNTARVIGQENLLKPAVAAAVKAAQEKATAKTGLQRERILREVELMAHSRIDNYLVDEFGVVTLAPGVPEDAWAAIKSIKRKRREWSDGEGGGHHVEVDVELTFWDKPGMVKLAGRHKAIEGFSDKLELPSEAPETDIEVFAGLPPDDDASAGRA